jgi:site-specific DNA-methyltransferase (adenine-specific)
MGKEWDAFVPQPIFWKECYRVLKHGGHVLSFAGTRTYDWMVLGLRLAGFEIRDQLAWIYGSGFPKSHDISKAIDKKFGAEREVVGKSDNARPNSKQENNLYEAGTVGKDFDITAPSTDQAKQWQGWGTALKPALEPIVMARKPLDGTVADNVLKHGVGGINIDGCRVEFGDEKVPRLTVAYEHKSDNNFGGGHDGRLGKVTSSQENATTKGRFPANVIHDGSDEVVALFPETKGEIGRPNRTPKNEKSNSMFGGIAPIVTDYGLKDDGSASRFFYTAKASQTERNWGLDGFESDVTTDGRNKPIDNAFNRGETQRKNIHPTVKPIDLMRYLVRLVTPKGGVCLDPFLGSGTTAVACKSEKFDYIGIELSQEYADIAEARIKAEVVQYDIFDILEG